MPAPVPIEADPEPVAEAAMAAEPDEAAISEVADPALDTVQAGIFDNGKMWTFEYPPLDYLRTTYGFSADEEWFRRAHLSALRIPSCSASFVSASGLVMTNHHCARGSIEQVSREGEDLVADGFYAATLEDERPIEDYYADQLIEIRDVTDRVYAGLEGVTGTQERADRRQEVTDEIVAEITEEFGGEDAGFNVEMVELYAGGRYSVYIFRRYTDLRLVISPELQVAYFGGDYDNFTYPRYDLDMTFYRVYDDNGEPLQTEFYFPFSEEGVSEGDLVFVIGNPGSTSRLQTVAELEYRRDVSDQSVVDLLKTRLVALHEYAESHPEEAREMDLRNTIFGFENSLKAYTGIVGGLHDPVKIAKRKDHERRFQAAIDADPDLQAEYGDLIPRMAELQAQKREHDAALSSFLAVGHPQLGSSTMARAFAAFQYLSAQSQGAPPEMVDELKDAIVATPDQPREINEAQLAQRFHDFIRNYGPDHPFVQGILEGRTPEGMAAVIMDGSMLADSATAVAALNTGGLSMDDPAVRIVLPIAQALGPAQQVQAMVTPEETEISSALGRALFEVYGTSVPPDATFSLRIADGVVQDYEYNGTVAPVYTTYYGMYDHYYSYGAGSDWDLPELWLSPPESFDLSTPLNFVSTADIIGGNSGSPVIDQNLQVVGLIFDGNIESLPGDYIYLPVENRAVAVDARGMLEALEEIYQADRIFQELVSGVLVGGN
ncbi:MAG: S46 family peptidase [Gemmatimonadetes bacterium]|nr:S46 family peptidase [Gemmatimonadota bacterium]